MSNLRTLLDNSETVFTNMTAAERAKQIKALQYIQFLSSNARIQLDNADIFKVFGDKTQGINRLAIDPKEINRRIFAYQAASKQETIDESMRCLALVLKRRKVLTAKNKTLIQSLSKITSQGYWRVVDLDRTHIIFATANDVNMVNNDNSGKIVNLGILCCEVTKKSLDTYIRPFKNNYYNLHPLMFDSGAICFGNTSDYMRKARGARDLVEVMNIMMLMCATFNYNNGDSPLDTPSGTAGSGPYEYGDDFDLEDNVDDDDERIKIDNILVKNNMTYMAYLYFDLINQDNKVNARTLKSTKNAGKKAKVVKSEAATKFVDDDRDEDDDYDEDED